MNLIETHAKEIAMLCNTHKVVSLSLFGSLAKGEATDTSDVDLLVTFGDVDLNNYADNFYDLSVSLEKLFGRRVDLITEKYITNPYLLKSINRNRIKIYERRNPGMAA
jgi:predicted nucleotidyltransferase